MVYELFGGPNVILSDKVLWHSVDCTEGTTVGIVGMAGHCPLQDSDHGSVHGRHGHTGIVECQTSLWSIESAQGG